MFENTDNLLLYEFSLSHKITTEFLVNTTKFLTWFWMNCWKYPSIAKIPLYQEYLDRLAASSEALPCWASLTLYWRFQLSLFRRITSFLMSGNSPVFDSLDWSQNWLSINQYLDIVLHHNHLSAPGFARSKRRIFKPSGFLRPILWSIRINLLGPYHIWQVFCVAIFSLLLNNLGKTHTILS